ncbi:MAG TPA: hypothetical protein VFC65_08545 [Prolixibacteraceae bacterium]|nr:hypothetical protein [Prolixibacteraceae bacterium]
MKILITVAADFIVFYTIKHFAERGNCIVGWVNINDYSDVKLNIAG